MLSTDNMMEVLAVLGAPSRVLGRLPLFARYLRNGISREMVNPEYAQSRYGRSWRWRPWLFFDIKELEVIEELINTGTDKRLLDFRKHQLQGLQMISIVGALVAGAALGTQQLPGVDKVSYVTRALFITTLVQALLATFFTCIQQRTHGFLEEPAAIRAWLANGVVYITSDGRTRFQSSLIAQQLLQAPFELLCISITTFLGGIGSYLGSTLVRNLKVGSGNIHIGNWGVLLVFVISTAFSLVLLGQILGCRDLEYDKCKRLSHHFRESGMGLILDEEGEKERESGTRVSAFCKESTKTSDFIGFISSPPKPKIATVPGFGDELKKALLEAAEAHRTCAAAEAKVAYCYEKILAHREAFL